MILKDLHGSVGARAGVQEPMPTLNPKGCVGLRGLLHSIQPSSRVCGAKGLLRKSKSQQDTAPAPTKLGQHSSLESLFTIIHPIPLINSKPCTPTP